MVRTQEGYVLCVCTKLEAENAIRSEGIRGSQSFDIGSRDVAKLAMRMRCVTWPGGRGHPKPYIWNQRPQFAYSLYNVYGATTTIKESLHGSTPIVKRFSVENCPVKSRPKMAVFRELRGVNVIKFFFSNPGRHILARNRVLWRSMRENRFGGLGCGALEEPPPHTHTKRRKEAEQTLLMHNFEHTGKGNPLRDRD